MKRFTTIAMVLTMGMMMLVSCKKDKNDNGNKVVFHATIESRAQDRTYLDPDPEHDKDDVKWSAGDKIKITNGNGESAVFTLQSGANTTEGTFVYAGEFGMVPPYTAVYPETATIDGASATFNLPATQTGTRADGANPMMAYSTDEFLHFKNLCGGLDIPLLGYNVHVSGIRIIADESEKLNGTFVVDDCSSDEPMLMSNQGTNGTNTVTLNCNVTLISATTPQEFFIILPVGALAQGFTMEVLNGGNVICTKHVGTNLAQIEHNKVKRLTPPLQMGENPPLPEGIIINSAFTINANGDQVYFSQGNLQYQASTNTWRFAEHQWDYVGTQTPDQYGYVGGTISGSDNMNISQTYRGWIDLFGWGTSGYDHGAVCYQPWSNSASYENYYAYGSYLYTLYNLYDRTGQADWGYNAISNGGNQENCGWRTLTKEEWKYVIHTRTTTSGIRWAKGTVNGVNGIILLPDNWTASIYTLNGSNGGSYGSNTITAADWTNNLEANGAVFLPAAGFRIGGGLGNNFQYVIKFSGINGYYWSSSYYPSNWDYYAANLQFYSSSINPQDFEVRNQGNSVRLVRNVQ